MAIALYMDVHIPRAITSGLRLRGVTAQVDNAASLYDSALLERATALSRVLFTFDDDLLVEAARLQRKGYSLYRCNFRSSFARYYWNMRPGFRNSCKGSRD